MNRSKMSLQLVLAGLYPPKETALEWNKNLNWQPIPFTFENLFEDSLLLVTKSCPRYQEELERVLKEDVDEELDKYTTMFEELSNYTGWNVKTPLYVLHLHGIFKAQEEFGLELPKWAKEYFPRKIEDLVEKAHIYNSYNAELKKLKGGPFVKKAFEDWNNKVQGKLKEKIFVYSAHDASGEPFCHFSNFFTRIIKPFFFLQSC
jgi:prostatic aicd phosphatase